MWHEAKKSEKKVHELMDTARKRAMRRAEFLAKRRGDPHQSIQLFGSRCRVHRDDGLYHAAQDQIGLIPWNGKEDNLIDRFDGRALLDFIRESGSRSFKAQEKTEEEEELEQFVNFESYRDLIKHRRRGFSEEEGLKYIQQELEAKNTISLNFDKPKKPQPKGSYSQVGFSYNNNKNNNNYNNNNGDDNDNEDSESESEESDDEFSSDDSNDEKMEIIAKDFGIKRYNWLVYSEKKAKEEVKRQKELIKGDPSIKKLSRRERRKISQMEREKERDSARFLMRGPQDPYRDPRRSPSYENYSRRRRSRSRSKSPSSYSRRHHHEKSKAPKIEYITEFGAGPPRQTKDSWQSPPSSPIQSDPVTRSTGGQSQILEALHFDPASLTRTIEQDKTPKFVKAPFSSSGSSSSGLAKLSKSATPGGPSKTPIGEKKETPQERLKRIMSSQLNKQIKKDTAAEQAKRREQEKERRERLAELSRLSRRSRSRSSSRDRSRHRSRSSSRDRSRHRSRDRSQSRGRSRSHSPPRRRRYSRSPRRYRTKSRSPSTRSRSRSRH